MEPTPDPTPTTDIYSAPLRSFEGGRLRQHDRAPADHDVYLTAANGAGPLVARGTCLDLSRGGFRAELDAPCPVGDVLQATLVDEDENAVEPRFARCLRCAIGPEGAYEASFQFLAPIELPRVGR